MSLLLTLPVTVKAMGRVEVGVSIPLPPPIVFAAPPEVVVIPETYVYVVPDIDVDIFFYDGWWWRPWQGRWYRSQSYSSGWAHYQNVPSFYGGIHAGWRNDYRERRWRGNPWNYQRIPHQQVQQNWSNWEKNRHWEKQNNWGVQRMTPQTRSKQPPPVARPQSREIQRQQPRSQPQAKPQVRQPPKPQPSRPQSREVQRQQQQPRSQVQPQGRQAAKPQPSKARQGKSEKKDENQQDRKHDRR